MSVFIIPRNDRNDVGMTQEWLEMSFLIIPRNDRNDVGMMVWLIQCPFLSFLSFVIFLCHSFISASFRHSKLISEWWAMRKMRNDVEWITKVDYFPLIWDQCWSNLSIFWLQTIRKWHWKIFKMLPLFKLYLAIQNLKYAHIEQQFSWKGFDAQNTCRIA